MKSETTVHVCVSTSVSMKPLDIFNKMLGHFPAEFVVTEPEHDVLPDPDLTLSIEVLYRRSIQTHISFSRVPDMSALQWSQFLLWKMR